ncbi:asparagine synthase (glutamine-hydrolyzing) [Paenibacillus sp. HJGM_3]|uniref:asparagine synthase (glutamine-hydrolyzing) n=1 Tax=Paenibacillus sp. HJGM_3 TaxID=3379816 RepID=UPI003858A67A
MCGITGVMYFDAREPKEAMLRQMMDVIEHRGPNDSGVFTDPGIGLGFRRLSIIDLKEGHQPLSNEDDTVWIVFNGEIYNYQRLREDLLARGHRFKTHTDTEVIVHLYEEYGEHCVDHLRGMYGFVIWDRRKRELFGARDHFGIKPFYYYTDGSRFLFGSEIKSLLEADGMERRVNEDSLLQYLTFQYVPEPETMFAGIRKLPPAHTIRITADGRMSVRRYWDPMFAPVQRPFADVVEELRAKLRDSVVHHMHSDVERGCFLSSGIDSTAIAAHMKRIEPIRTFSVGFDGPNNETVIARQTAQALGTEHYEKLITADDFFGALPKAIWHQDEPVADPSAIALYHVAGLAAEHITVVLSGEGADELFGGYRIYREPLSLRPLAWLPRPVMRLVHQLVRFLPDGVKGRNYLLRGTTPLEERFLGNAKLLGEAAKAELLQLDRKRLRTYRDPWQVAGDFYSKTRHLDPVSRMQYIDMNLWLPGDILMKADKMTMAHSLELRVPFLDKELFEFARTIPMEYRLAEGTTKYVFRKAMEGIIPDFILNRPKLGFPVPLREWVKGPQGAMMREQIRSSGIEPYFDLKVVDRMFDQHAAGHGDFARWIWAVYVFGLWHATYMQGATSPGLGLERQLESTGT